MRDFRQYAVWGEARKLTADIYRDTREYPADELFGLTSQLRRACVSISANIAEGCGRDKEMDLARFLDLAMGSAKEVECLLIISDDLGLLETKIFKERERAVLVVQSMLAKFLEKIRKSSK